MLGKRGEKSPQIHNSKKQYLIEIIKENIKKKNWKERRKRSYIPRPPDKASSDGSFQTSILQTHIFQKTIVIIS